MRITQVMLAKGFGGAERAFVDLSLALAKRGHQVQAICHKRFVQQRRLLEVANLRLDRVTVQGSWDRLAVRRIARFMKGFQPHVVHAHLARGAYLAGEVTRRLNLPLMVKTHNAVKLKYYGNVDHFVTTTRGQRDYLIRQGVSAQAITVIPNFSRLAPVESKPEQDELTFAAYGRMVAKKGFAILIGAFAMVLEEGIHARLLIGGDGPDSGRLARLVRDLGLGSKISFCGWIDDVEVFLAKADIFVLPSLHEPFGIAVLEAMASHTATIATRTQGPLEILDDESAYLVDTGDRRALARAMCRAARDPCARRAKCRAALRRFRSAYSSEVVVPQYLELYRRFRASR